MKRLTSSTDSLLSFISISSSSPTDEMHFTEDIQTMLDSIDGENNNEMEIHPKMGKKRRLSLKQVRAMEKQFEVDNKLEPDRKVKLAMELGLQPRQVAVWFQNRRARWKNKQLEKEYEVLKSSYEELTLSYANAGREKEALNAELRDLKLKLAEVSESESNNRNNIINNANHEPMVDVSQQQTWSCFSSSITQLDHSPEDLGWFQWGTGAAGEEGGPAGPSWFSFEVDH